MAAREEDSGGQGVKALGRGKWRRVLHSVPLDYHKDGEVDSYRQDRVLGFICSGPWGDPSAHHTAG